MFVWLYPDQTNMSGTASIAIANSPTYASAENEQVTAVSCIAMSNDKNCNLGHSRLLHQSICNESLYYFQRLVIYLHTRAVSTKNGITASILIPGQSRELNTNRWRLWACRTDRGGWRVQTARWRRLWRPSRRHWPGYPSSICRCQGLKKIQKVSW